MNKIVAWRRRDKASGAHSGKRSKFTLQEKKAGLGLLFVTPWLLGFIFLFLVPLYQSFVYSLNKLTLGKGGFDTRYVGFQFYQ